MFTVNLVPALGFPCGLTGKESTCHVGNLGSIPGLGRVPGERKGYRFQYSGLENSMDYIVHGVAKSQTQLSNFHFHLVPALCVQPWFTSTTTLLSIQALSPL